MGKIIDVTQLCTINNKRITNMCTILEKIKGKTPMELLEEYKIPLTPPIDLSKLLEKIGISTIAQDFTEIEKNSNVEPGCVLGAAISKGDSLAIFYRKSDSYNRKKFTIAHELAHCCLHTDSLRISHVELRIADYTTNEKERDANTFAGELLIPKNILMEKYEEFIIPSLKTLSEIFEVSYNVMAARLDHLGLSYLKDVKIDRE